MHNALRLTKSDLQTWARILGRKGAGTGLPGPKQFGGLGWNSTQRHLFEEEAASPGRRASCPSVR